MKLVRTSMFGILLLIICSGLIQHQRSTFPLNTTASHEDIVALQIGEGVYHGEFIGQYEGNYYNLTPDVDVFAYNVTYESDVYSGLTVQDENDTYIDERIIGVENIDYLLLNAYNYQYTGNYTIWVSSFNNTGRSMETAVNATIGENQAFFQGGVLGTYYLKLNFIEDKIYQISLASGDNFQTTLYNSTRNAVRSTGYTDGAEFSQISGLHYMEIDQVSYEGEIQTIFIDTDPFEEDETSITENDSDRGSAFSPPSTQNPQSLKFAIIFFLMLVMVAVIYSFNERLPNTPKD